MNELEKVRPEIEEFALAMEQMMSMHDGRKGDSWKTCDLNHLQKKLLEEFAEYIYPDEECFVDAELIDIANICMMLYHRIRKSVTKG